MGNFEATANWWFGLHSDNPIGSSQDSESPNRLNTGAHPSRFEGDDYGTIGGELPSPIEFGKEPPEEAPNCLSGSENRVPPNPRVHHQLPH